MIPIECPKCGRGGSVPPDRMNARLVCKACHTVFHLDTTGRMVLGEPGSVGAKQPKARPEKSASVEAFDLAQTLKDIPAPVRYGVPAILLCAALWMTLGPGEGSPDYVGQAEAVMRALASNDRSKVVSYASSDSTEAAGKWFDLMHGELEKSKIGSNVAVTVALLSGNPDRDSQIVLMAIVAETGTVTPPVSVNLPMKKDGSTWRVDANGSLANAKSAVANRKGP